MSGLQHSSVSGAQWSPPVTTLEALLGHITEHLLQLLGVAEHQRGRKEGVGMEEVRGFL